jgi:hypothetical protein
MSAPSGNLNSFIYRDDYTKSIWAITVQHTDLSYSFLVNVKDPNTGVI